jgi:hypothetical protein
VGRQHSTPIGPSSKWTQKCEPQVMFNKNQQNQQTSTIEIFANYNHPQSHLPQKIEDLKP